MAGNEPQFTAEEAGINSVEISLESVEQLFSDINNYNQENSPEGIICEAISASVRACTPPSEIDITTLNLISEFTIGTEEHITSLINKKIKSFKNGENTFENQNEIENFIKSINNQKQTQEDYFNGISDYHETLLEQLGLSIERTNNQIIVNLTDHLSDTNENRVDIGQIRIYIPFREVEFESSEINYSISNGEKFLSFLNSLDPKTLDNNFRNQLLKLIESFASQQAFTSKKDEDITSQLLSQYERFNTNSALRFFYPQKQKDNL